MKSIPDDWKPRHVEAYTAWKRGNQDRLIKACDPEIRKLANRFATASRRGRSDELRQPSQQDRFEAGRQKEAALVQDGLHEAKEVADFDELYQVGHEAVLDAMDRYDPEKGVPPQAFVRKRIRGAMIDLLREKQMQQTQKQEEAQDVSNTSFAAVLETTLRMVRDGERDESAFIEALDRVLEQISLQEGHDAIDELGVDAATFIRSYLYTLLPLVLQR